MNSILAIDQSTSATKALLYDARGQLIAKHSIQHRQIYPQPGWVEHDANEIWRNTQAVIQAPLSSRGQGEAPAEPSAAPQPARREPHAPVGTPVCLSISNQRETIVVFDRGSGAALCNALVWQDRRGEAICAELAKHETVVAKKTGLKIDPYFSASKLAWIVRNRADISQKLKDGEALVGTIDAYLIYRLTEGKVFATDHTNASRTLLFDISNLKWDAELCEMFGVPMRALPEVRDSTAKFGEARINAREIPICGVMGDSQASLFAHRCYTPGMAKVTLGSGSSVLLNIGPELRMSDGAVSTIAWTHDGNATYSFEGIVNYTGATIQWLKDQLGLIKDAGETEQAACGLADNGGVYLVPAFSGLSAPYWSPTSRAAIVGMSAHTNRHTIIRAALESIAYQLRDVLDMMRRSAGAEFRAINADGGATRNKFLMQFIADMTGLEVNAAQIPDCSPLGAAMAGMVGMGIVGSIDELRQLPREVVTYSPQMPRDQVERFYAGWKRAVKQVLVGAETK